MTMELEKVGEDVIIAHDTSEGGITIVTVADSDNVLSSDETIVEQVTDTAVQIAEIEADKEIKIAAIHAEVETTAIEARSNQDQETWLNYQSLREQVETLAEKVEIMMETIMLLTPPVLAEIMEKGTETGTETITPETIKEMSDEIRTEVQDEKEDEKPEQEIQLARRIRVL